MYSPIRPRPAVEIIDLVRRAEDPARRGDIAKFLQTHRITVSDSISKLRALTRAGTTRLSTLGGKNDATIDKRGGRAGGKWLEARYPKPLFD